MEGIDENTAIAHVSDRLADRYPAVERGEIDSLVESERAHFDDAHVRDHVPNLIEHGVRAKLGPVSSGGVLHHRPE